MRIPLSYFSFNLTRTVAIALATSDRFVFPPRPRRKIMLGVLQHPRLGEQPRPLPPP